MMGSGSSTSLELWGSAPPQVATRLPDEAGVRPVFLVAVGQVPREGLATAVPVASNASPFTHGMTPRGLPPPSRAFTLVELLGVLVVIALLAGLLLPALGRARQHALATACRSHLRQQGLAWELYLGEQGDRFPDRRDLKSALPGGYKPWTTWPRSDPRAGWAAAVLRHELSAAELWQCPATRRPFWEGVTAVWQAPGPETNAGRVSYWMWRFDRADDPVPLDNFWAKTRAQAVSDLATANHPLVGAVHGPGEVELVTDVYFPATAPGVEEALSGRAPHPRGRNRLYLDGHVAWGWDRRLQ